MSDLKAPSIYNNSFNCPHCGAFAHQQWYEVCVTKTECLEQNSAIKLIIESNYSLTEKFGEKPIVRQLSNSQACDEELLNNKVCRCYSCKDITIWVGETLVYPNNEYSIKPNLDLLEDIQEDFREAAAIFNQSPRGSAALLRLCIQKLCKQVGQKGKNINTDIAEMVKNGLDVRIQKALDIVRVTGNEAVHPGEMNLNDDRQTAAELFNLVNIIADTLITQPKRLDASFANLPQSKIQAISERDGKKDN